MGQLFNGRRGLALDVPFGLVDFIEVLQGGRLVTDTWYPFLNLGFKVNPAAGSDYPYFGPSLPGVERYYVKLAWRVRRRRLVRVVPRRPRVRDQRSAAGFHHQRRGDGRGSPRARGATLDVAARRSSTPTSTSSGSSSSSSHGDVIATERGNGAIASSCGRR